MGSNSVEVSAIIKQNDGGSKGPKSGQGRPKTSLEEYIQNTKAKLKRFRHELKEAEKFKRSVI